MDMATTDREKRLFTPGPLSTSHSVKLAMLRDVGSRDAEFMGIVRDIRQRLLDLGHVSADEYTSVLFPGSGTYAIESVIGSTVPRGGKLLILVNGAYGERMAEIASLLEIDLSILRWAENCTTEAPAVEAALEADPRITHVAVVHCETSTGIVNPVEAIGQLVERHGKSYIVDAMSSFGAIPLSLHKASIDYLVSSANKCIEGVPGFAFVLARIKALATTERLARSLSLNLFAQWKNLEATGQFRFTPPTHALLAFRQALDELQEEGGIAGRASRYQANYAALVDGMRALGFTEYLQPERQGYIITAFHYPTHPRFDFTEFYARLNERGFVIYPGKVSQAACFRIGSIGRLYPHDMQELVNAIGEVLHEMGVELDGRLM